MPVLHELYRICASVRDRLSIKIRSARLISLCARKHCITRLWIDFVVWCVVYLARVYFEQIINLHDGRVTWTANTATQRAASNCAPAKYGHTDAAAQLAVDEFDGRWPVGGDDIHGVMGAMNDEHSRSCRVQFASPAVRSYQRLTRQAETGQSRRSETS